MLPKVYALILRGTFGVVGFIEFADVGLVPPENGNCDENHHDTDSTAHAI